MSNLVEIKKRIASITSTIKVTKVMQMIATAKVAKIKQMMVTSNRYTDIANDMLSKYYKYTQNVNEIERFFDKKRGDNEKKCKKILLVLLSSDKGTCGSINTNIFKEFSMLVKQHLDEGNKVFVCPIGKKAVKFLETHGDKMAVSVLSDIKNDAENCNPNAINEVVTQMVNAYVNDGIDEICFVYHKFKNIITCNAVCERILPLSKEMLANNAKDEGFVNIYEVDNTPTSMVNFFVRTLLYGAYVSNLASIVSSRMNAMDNATKNGQEIIDDLRIKYNKGRQSGITSELSDIVSGFEAIS